MHSRHAITASGGARATCTHDRITCPGLAKLHTFAYIGFQAMALSWCYRGQNQTEGGVWGASYAPARCRRYARAVEQMNGGTATGTGEETTMVIPILPKVTVGELAPRRTFRGRLAANRQLRGVAIIAALVLVLATTLLGGRALSSERTADTAAAARSSGGSACCMFLPRCRSATRTCRAPRQRLLTRMPPASRRSRIGRTHHRKHRSPGQ